MFEILCFKVDPIKSPEDLDISKMFTMYKNLNRNIQTWNKLPGKNEIDEADNIKRIRHYRNQVCHSDASEIETADFNTRMLDLLGVRFFWARTFNICLYPIA